MDAGVLNGPIDRRTFVLATLTMVNPAARQPRLETLRQWLDATPDARTRALKSVVDRISEMDRSIQAWVRVGPQPPLGEGPLAGIPFGAKDIMDTEAFPTEYGSPVYKGRRTTSDAAVVDLLRRRGAVLLGKTHTAAFAYRTPPPTRNPRNPAHTPGGSSSGSAAAVAAGMVPFALGTQTGGSILRPASYCGITGFKASFGLLSLDGVLPFSRSLDTLGFFTHTAADMLALWESIGFPSGSSEVVELAVPEPMPDVDPPMAAAFRASLSQLQRAGFTVRPVDIAVMLTRLVAAQRTIMFYEGARLHEPRFRQHGDALLDLADLVREGLQIPVEAYAEARRHVAESRQAVTELYRRTPLIALPAATGPAPFGLASTGDSRMNAPWTALGTPAISIPMPGAGLPLGLQLTADHGQDALVIRTALRVEQALGASSRD